MKTYVGASLIWFWAMSSAIHYEMATDVTQLNFNLGF